MIQTPILSQRDSRWAWKYLGFSTGTIGNFGCLIACITMLARESDISRTNDLMKATGDFNLGNGGGAYAGNLVVWGNVQNAIKSLKLIERGWSYNNDKVKAWLAKGYPVIVQVDATPIGSPRSDHFVLYVGDQKLVDPWTGKIRPTSDFPEVLGYALYTAPVGQTTDVFKQKCEDLKVATSRVDKELGNDLAAQNPNYEAIYKSTMVKEKTIAETGTL